MDRVAGAPLVEDPVVVHHRAVAMEGGSRAVNSRGANNFNNCNVDNGNRCQVCFKKNHTAAECWHRFDEDYVPDQRLVAAASYSYGVDTNWYTDTGATDHVTGELDKLTIKNKYHGND